MNSETHEAADRTPCGCPWCGHDGGFDGLGQFKQDSNIIISNGKKELVEYWYTEIHCPQCDSVFAMRSER